MLIHTFVFGWAMEYVFFVIEIVAAFIFYYYWGRLPPKTHTSIGWIYAVAAWISLVLITGITAFMLNPGAGRQNPSFWVAFFNPVPAADHRPHRRRAAAGFALRLPARGLSARRTRAARPDRAALHAAGPAGGGAGHRRRRLVAAGPARSARAALAAASVLNILMVLIFAVTVVVFVMLYLGPYRNPGLAVARLRASCSSLRPGAVGAGEFIREAVRKPYIIYNVVLGNQILADEIPRLRADGLPRGRHLDAPGWRVAGRRPRARRPHLGDPARAAGRDRRRWGRSSSRPLQRLPRRTRTGFRPREPAHARLGRTRCSATSSAPGQGRISSCRRGPARREEAGLLREYLSSIALPYPAGLPRGRCAARPDGRRGRR